MISAECLGCAETTIQVYIPDQRRGTHRIDQSRCKMPKNKSVVVLSPQLDCPNCAEIKKRLTVIGLAACHTNWKMEQVRRADQGLYPVQIRISPHGCASDTHDLVNDIVGVVGDM